MKNGILCFGVIALAFSTGSCGEGGSEEPYSGSVTQAAWCKVANSPCCNNCAGSPALVLSILNANKSVGGDGTLTLRISGDLDDLSDEILTVSVEGFSLGTIFNGDPNDDAFDLPGDEPEDCTLTVLAANLPRSTLAGIVSDGRIDISLTPRQDVNDIEDDGCEGAGDETVTITVEYPVS